MPAVFSKILPQEIIDMTIDHLSSDNNVLKQCTLVCKSWMSRSSRHLLRSVTWPPRILKAARCLDDKPYFEDCRCLTAEEASFATCVQILSSSIRLRLYVRVIGLSSARDKCKKRSKNRTHEAADYLTIASILDRLPYLETLVLYDFELQSEPSPPHLQKRYNIKTLDARRIREPLDAQTLSQFLSLFKCVRHFIFPHGIQVLLQDTAPPPCQPAEALEIETLGLPNFRSEFIDPLCYLLRTRINPACLRKLICQKVTPGVAALISTTPNLESLGLTFLDHPRILTSLSSPPPLTRVSLDFILFIDLVEYPDEHFAILEDTCELLKGLVSFDLREVVISIDTGFTLPDEVVDAHSSFEDVLPEIGDWEAVCIALNPFKSLQALVIELNFDRDSWHLVDQKPGRCTQMMRNFATHHMPKKYIDILRVREACSGTY